MIQRAKLLASALLFAPVTLYAAHGSAQTVVNTVCARVGVDDQAAVDLKLAIASNFYGSAQKLAADYIADTGNVDSIVVCHNATGTLNNEIRGTNVTTVNTAYTPIPAGADPIYDYLFAANTSVPSGLVTYLNNTFGFAPATYTYARGIPVLVSRAGSGPGANPNVNTVGDLITELGDGTHYTMFAAGATAMGPLELNPNAGEVGFALPSSAPYAAQARLITTQMGYVWPGNADVPPTDAVIHQSPFANVAQTFQALGTTHNGGFVGSVFISKAQICAEAAQPGTPIRYVEFQNHLLDQGAVPLRNNATVNAFVSYMASRLSSDWNDFLIDECYATVSAGTPVPIGDFTAPFTAALLLAMGYMLSRKAQQQGVPA